METDPKISFGETRLKLSRFSSPPNIVVVAVDVLAAVESKETCFEAILDKVYVVVMDPNLAASITQLFLILFRLTLGFKGHQLNTSKIDSNSKGDNK